MRLTRRTFVTLALVTAGAIAAFLVFRPDTPPAWQYAIRLDVRTCDGRGSGSAFATSDDTLVTNRHVVEDAITITPKTWDGETLTVKDIETSSRIDIALIHLAETTDWRLALSRNDPISGDRVTTVGYPKGGPAAVGKGRVVEYIDGDRFDLPSRVISAEVDTTEPGSSGGPLLSEDREVVGLVFAIERQTGRTLALPPSEIASDLEAKRRFRPLNVDCD